MDVTESVRQAIRPENLRGGDTVLCAVSGGADSVCMLHALHTVAQEQGFALSCVHVHHGIRGKEADEDASFVRTLCADLQVPFVLKKVNVPVLAKETPHAGIEERARQARYEVVEEEAGRIMRQQDPEAGGDTGPDAAGGGSGKKSRVRIAVAHTADDNAETVLFQLFRGTGLRGLAGIRPLNGFVIRPLLTVFRRDIEAYLSAHGLSWRTDHTNDDVTYARNRIRHVLLPEIEKELNTNAKEHIVRTAGDVRDMLRYVEARVEEAGARCRVTASDEEISKLRGAQVFSVKKLRGEDAFLRGELIRKVLSALQELSGKGAYYQIRRVHVEAVLKLCEGANGRACLDLPGDIRAKRLHDNLILFLSA